MASRFISRLARYRPASASPILLDHVLQVHLETRSITASKCVSNWHNYGPQVYLQHPRIRASKCISKLAQSQPPSVSPNLHNYSLKVHHQCRSIPVSEWMSLFTRSGCSEPVVLEVRQRHQQHSAAPYMASEENSWERAFLARRAFEEGERIGRDTRPWWTTHIMWIYESLARVSEVPP